MSAALAELFHKWKGDECRNVDIFALSGEQGLCRNLQNWLLFTV